MSDHFSMSDMSQTVNIVIRDERKAFVKADVGGGSDGDVYQEC